MLGNYQSAYEDLLNKTGKSNMSLRGTRSLCIEINCVKSVQIQREIFMVRIRKKYGPEKTPCLDNFRAVIYKTLNNFNLEFMKNLF